MLGGRKKGSQDPNSFFGPWPMTRRIAFWAALVLGLFLVVVATVPVGIAAVGVFIVWMRVWPDTSPSMDPNKVSFIPGTRNNALAEFFMAARMRFEDSRRPVVTLGFGPPRADEDHDISGESWLPPTRLAAWWSLLAAVPVSLLDWAINPILFTAWGGLDGFRLPGPAMALLSAIGWFALAQFIVDIRRWRAEGVGIIGAAPAPAVMLHKANITTTARGPLTKAAVASLAVAVLALMVLLVSGLPWWWTLIVFAVAFAVSSLAMVSRGVVEPYREHWQELIDQREEWMAHNEPLKELATSLIDTTDLPSEDDWASSHPGEAYAPYMHVTRAMFPPGASFQDYVGKEDMLAGRLQASQLVFAPMEERDSNGRAIPGTAGHDGMCVWYTTDDKRYTISSVFDEDAKPWERDFAIRENLIKRLRDVRGIGECLLVTYTVLTKPPRRRRNKNATRNLMEVKIRPFDPNVGVNNFRDGNVVEALRLMLQVEYVRAKGQEGTVISLLIGDSPAFTDQIEYKRPGMSTQRAVRNAEFAHVFHINKIFTSFGTPVMVDYAEIDSVEEQEFVLPDGIKFDHVHSQLDAIMENTGNSFMEIRRGRSAALAAQRSSRAGGDERDETKMLSITSAKVNPLNQMFEMGAYKDQVITGRTPGKESVKWSPGVLSNGQLAWDDFNSAEPHLLIAGSSGSGKAQALTTEVFSQEGWKTVGDLAVGDTLYDMNGFATRVTRLHEVFRPKNAYRVTFSTGETIEVNDEHLWTLTTGDKRRRAARASASGTGDVWAVRAGDYLDRAGAWDVLAVNPVRFPHRDIGSAWFRDGEGVWREASSWIGCGRMAEASPHVSSRIAQSAIRGVPAELWGLLIGSRAGDGRTSAAWKVPSANADRAAGLLGGHGYPTARDAASDATTTYLRIPGLAPLIARAWEEDNDRAGFARDVIDVIGFTPEFLHGLRLAARVDGDRFAWTEPGAADAVSTVLGAYGVAHARDGGVVTASRADVDAACDGARPGVFRGTEAYFQGLFDACGMSIEDGGRTVHYLTVADPSVRYHLLERGMVCNQERTGMGVERVLVQDGRAGAFDGFDRDLDDLERIEYVRGLVASHGRVVDGRVVVTVDDDIVGRVRERAAGVPTVRIERGERGFEVSVDIEYVTAAASDFVDVAQTVRAQRRYDAQGRVVMSIPELEAEFGWSRAEAEAVTDGLHPSAVWRAPIVQRFVTGVHAKVSGEIDLFPVAQVCRRAALLRGEERPPVPSPGAMATITTAELAETFIPGVYSVPLADVNDPAAPCCADDVAYVTGIEEIPEDEIPLMRCITVDSPTSTYRVGRTLIPTHNSVIVQSMIVQMINNNHPDDLRMWMVEPKIGLQRFRNYDTVERFVDSWTPTEDFFGSVADLAHDMVEEMLARNRALAQYKPPNGEAFVIPEKLSQARDIARKDGVVMPDGTRHPLMMPYMLCIIEECATVFAESANKEQRDLQTQILTDIARIARESRSAGIYLVCLTQYPTNASIPSVIRNQMRRIGLACKNSLASRVCIDQDGLEQLSIKGTGLIADKSGKSYQMFRGLFLKDGNPREGERNDIIDLLSHIPTHEDGESVTGPAGDPYIQIEDVAADDVVGRVWESINGLWLDEAVEQGRKTPDYTDEAHLSRLASAGIKETNTPYNKKPKA